MEGSTERWRSTEGGGSTEGWRGVLRDGGSVFALVSSHKEGFPIT